MRRLRVPLESARTDGKLRVLSVQQPSAAAIMSREPDRKPIENRPWWTGYRGRLYIHASKGIDRNAPPQTWRSARLGNVPRKDIAVGMILGYVTLTEIYGPGEYDSPWVIPGQYHWLLTDPVRLVDPLPCRGALGFWFAPDGLKSMATER